MIATKEEVLDFWLEYVGQDGWYRDDPELDREIREKFQDSWAAAVAKELCHWMLSPRGALALLILTDQFPRNMFRGKGEAFSSDELALSIARKSVQQGYDLEIPEPERQFFYLPLIHAESLSWQEKGVRLVLTRMSPEHSNLLHARAHREVIRRFGRFPHRNEALGRRTTPAEAAYIHSGGYGSTVREMQH